MSIKNTTKSTRLPLNKALKAIAISVTAASLLSITGCGHNDVPSTVHGRSGVTEKPAELDYDHIQYENTSRFDVPRNNLYARMPSVQAHLSQGGGNNYVGSKSAYNAAFPRYILIDANDVDKWRFAQVDSPRANRSYYAPPMRLPISQEVPVGRYIAVRPMTKLWPATESARKDAQPDAYLFSVLASADARESAGNLLTLSAAVDAVQNGDWIVPIRYLDLPQKSVSSVMENNPPTVITFAPGNKVGASGQVAIIRGGLNQGLSYGDNAIVIPGRLRELHARANRDDRDIRPEGIARVRVIQAVADYALVEIIDSAQAITEGDILVFQHGGKSK